MRRLVPLALLLTLSTATAQVPTFDDVVVGQVPLDAGGTMPLLTDIYLPQGATSPTPVVIWIHGGGWATGTHNGLPAAILELRNSGVALVSAAYRLSHEAIFPAQIHDVKGLIRFLRANAAQYNIDPARIACWGASAGGHLAALAATSGGVAELEGTSGGNLNQSSRIVAAVNYFGPTDLLEMNPDIWYPPGSLLDHDAPDSYPSMLIGFDGPGEGIGMLRANQTSLLSPIPEKLALAILANPITHITPDDAPIYVAHGQIDNIVPVGQSQRLYDAGLVHGTSPILKLEPASGHGSLSNSTYAESRAFLLHQFNGGAQAVGAPYCFGDGSGAACPCANANSATSYSGCLNSTGSGSQLRAAGVPSISADSLLLSATQLPPSTVIFVQGSQTVSGGDGAAHGFGILCVTGSVVRLATRPTFGGNVRYPDPGEGTISQRGGITAGSTRYFQAVYRDTPTFCGGVTVNMSNAHAVTFTP
ncbi:MAG: alpha/beta hydrolase [Planctomycetes bacterium]|nr:alpha/beta hydrolase [Planctomycetota bacterium]